MAVTADHGEEFLDHGGRFHAPVKLTEELIHVPLLMRVPGVPHRDVQRPVSLIDLAPTLLEALDIPSPAGFWGRSCLAKVETAKQRPAITEAVRACSNPFHRESRTGPRLLAVRKDNLKLVMDFSSGVEQLFALNSDPRENAPLALGAPSPQHKELLEIARKHLAESHKSRDFDRRNATLLRDLRLEWAHPAASTPN